MSDDRFSLGGRVAVITGGTKGIGAAIARDLGCAGAQIVIVARHDDAVDQAVSELEEIGFDAFGCVADIRDEVSVGRLFADAVEHFGRIDVLVNNAGGSFSDTFGRGDLLDLTVNDFIEAYRLNVVGPLLCSKAAVTVMRRTGGGSIVQISSMSAYQIQDGMGAYGPTKAALLNLTAAMAREWAPAVRVNAIVPGYIDTPRVRAHRTPEDVARLLSEIALGSLGLPEDVASAVRYFASPASSWVTGAVIRVDGGQKL